LVAGIVENDSQGDAEVEGSELPQEGTDFRGGNVGGVREQIRELKIAIKDKDFTKAPERWRISEDSWYI